jgi:hypothetical protein
MKGSIYCYWHDPDRTADRAKASRKGGTRSQAEGLDDWVDRQLNNIQDVEKLIVDLLNATIRGDIHPRAVNAASGLIGLLLKARELGSLEERIAKLEEKVGDERRARS